MHSTLIRYHVLIHVFRACHTTDVGGRGWRVVVVEEVGVEKWCAEGMVMWMMYESVCVVVVVVLLLHERVLCLLVVRDGHSGGRVDVDTIWWVCVGVVVVVSSCAVHTSRIVA